MMAFPLIIAEDSNNLYFFDSLNAAHAWIEPIDVENGEYTGYDAEGRKLRLHITGVTRTIRRFLGIPFLGYGMAGGGDFTIELGEDTPEHAHELESLLKKYLSAIQRECEIIQIGDLQSLIKIARS